MYEDMQVTVAYNKDPSPVKLNLGVGAYRTEVSFPDGCLLLFDNNFRPTNDYVSLSKKALLMSQSCLCLI